MYIIIKYTFVCKCPKMIHETPISLQFVSFFHAFPFYLIHIHVPYLFLKNRRRSPASEGLREAPTFQRQRKVTMLAEVQPVRCGVWDRTVDRRTLMTRLMVSDTSSSSLAQFLSTLMSLFLKRPLLFFFL